MIPSSPLRFVWWAALAIGCAGCSVGGNEARPDADGDGIADALEIAHGLDPSDPADAALDGDGDGLSNADEINVHGTDIADADSDDDALSDGDEARHSTDPHVADTDGDTLQDGAEVATFGTDPTAADTDGDGLNDGVETAGFKLYDKTTVVTTDPLSVDTDSDGIQDAIEKAVQDTFAGYASPGAAATFLEGALHPNNEATKPALGGLQFTDPTLTAAALELDPDGDGKPTIEEVFHATNPNDASSEFTYVYEQSAAGDLKPRFQAMTAANFVLVPGGWDVDGDGATEPAFFMARYEAKSTGVANASTANLPQLLAGPIVYNRTAMRFADRLCDNTDGGDGTDADTTDATGACRGNKYALAGTGLATPGTVDQVAFAPAGTPYVGLTWFEARLALRASPVDAAATSGGPFAIELPTEKQALQVVRLAINNAENWIGGVVGTGLLYQGHSDNAPANALAVANAADGYDQTGNSSVSGAGQRRTLVLANGKVARDFTVPLTHRVEIWDFSGNVAEWTLGVLAANHSTSSPTGRAGGDRFADGLSELENYSGGNLSGPTGDIASMPAWWKPILNAGTILGAAAGVGVYHDGFSGSDLNADGKSDGGLTNTNYGYGTAGYPEGFVCTLRGGHYASGSQAGIATADLQNGPGRVTSQIGFRAAAATQ